MWNNIVEAGVTIALAVIGLAFAATIFSRNANTTGVIQAGASGLGNDIAVAESPVTGTQIQANLNYPANSLAQGFGS